jgi:hypothetical protein
MWHIKELKANVGIQSFTRYATSINWDELTCFYTMHKHIIYVT